MRTIISKKSVLAGLSIIILLFAYGLLFCNVKYELEYSGFKDFSHSAASEYNLLRQKQEMLFSSQKEWEAFLEKMDLKGESDLKLEADNSKLLMIFREVSENNSIQLYEITALKRYLNKIEVYMHSDAKASSFRGFGDNPRLGYVLVYKINGDFLSNFVSPYIEVKYN